MNLEVILRLFDSYWFDVEILKKHSNPTPPLNSQKHPDHKIQENSPEILNESSLLEIKLGSQRDDLSYNSDPFSPDSVLQTTHFTPFCSKAELKKVKGRRRRRTKKGLSKSLSELEYEEVKGFMDLGFEFSEEDVNSSLVEVIPGLQKLGKSRDSGDQVKVNCFDKSESRARPYLSEAWEVLEKKNRMNTLINWKIPATNNEIDVKQSLKRWAHTVASTVKA